MAKAKPTTRSAKSTTKSAPASQPDGAADFLKATRKLGSAWKEAREVAADAGGFGQVEMADGVYEARVSSARVGVYENKKTKEATPYFSINLVVTDGVEKGKQPSIFNRLESDMDLEILSKTLQRLGFNTAPSDDEDGLDLSELPDVATALTSDKPLVQIQVKNRVGKDGVRRLQVYVNKLL